MVQQQLEEARRSVARVQDELRDYKGRAQALLKAKDAEVGACESKGQMQSVKHCSGIAIAVV